MRGTHFLPLVCPRKLRFIPAYAGNATSCTRRCRTSSVHPRVCGERVRRLAQSDLPGGSSPRMRGTHEAKQRDVRPARFIPAYAGNAKQALPIRRKEAVHPRVCGERALNLAGLIVVFGSSPRMRGTQSKNQTGRQMTRFIPAYAGNASTALAKRSTAPVHPRVCGERPSIPAQPCRECGSSPRMRGTPPSARHSPR